MSDYESFLIDCLKNNVQRVEDYENIISTVYEDTWNVKHYLAAPIAESRFRLFGNHDKTSAALFSSFVYYLCTAVYDGCANSFINIFSDTCAKSSCQLLPVAGYVNELGALTVYVGYKYGQASADMSRIARESAARAVNKFASARNASFSLDTRSRVDKAGELVTVKINISDPYDKQCVRSCSDADNKYVYCEKDPDGPATFTAWIDSVRRLFEFTCSDPTKKISRD